MVASHEGSRRNHAGILQLLLDNNVDVEVVNRKGRSTLLFAAAPSMRRPTATSTLRLLLEAGADISTCDMNGLTVKARAITEGRKEAVLIFREFEAKAANRPKPFRIKDEL